MNLYIVAVKDRAIDTFMRPFTVQTRGQATRSFNDEVNRQDSELHKHPEDYDLYELGTFDDNTGRLTSHETPQLIERAQDAINTNS